ASRYGHKMVYNSKNNIVVLFGGNGMGSGHEEDTWVFFSNNNTWKNLNPSQKPTERYWHSMAYDSTLEQVVLFGGSSLNIDKNDIWVYSYSNNSWSLNYVPNSPSPRHFAALAYDSTHCKVILYGGNNEAHNPMNDTWIYDFILNRWEKFSNS
ncbi:MAG: hypothetical protein EAX86_04165, partial [Candidatus Heimdallarchaeota archaeon]|nr:hypothetical protein [Candidatus Heimdallarchaeota archaeon]